MSATWAVAHCTSHEHGRPSVSQFQSDFASSKFIKKFVLY